MIATVPSSVAPFKNCMEPVAPVGNKAAVRVTAWPKDEVDRSAAIVTVEVALFTVCGTALEVAVR